jgi:tetratricopeptide (TPR) repeat protein
MNSFRWAMAFLFVGMVGTSSAVLSAQSKPGHASSVDTDGKGVEKVINEAIELFQAGRYKLSIEKFQQAYEVVEDANILFNIARCYHILGDKDNAIEYYNRFMYHPDVSEDSKERAKKYLEELRQDKSDASSGAPQYTDPGASAGGTQPEGDSAGSGAFGQSSEFSDDTKSPSRVLEWSLIGSGIAVGVAGGVLGGVALSKHSAFESSHDVSEKEDLENKGKTLSLASDICLGVGIATAVTGVILLVVRSQKSKKQSSTSEAYAPRLAPGNAGMSLALHF